MSRARDIADGTLNSADINGGNIDNTTIGGSTPAAGTFTTFTSNGIDDNLTSGGPALTIDSSGKVGIGTDTVEVGGLQISNSLNIDLKNVSGNPRVYFGHDNFAASTSNFIEVDRNTESMSFQVNDSSRMRIDSSGNVQLTNSLTAGTIGSGVVFPAGTTISGQVGGGHILQVQSVSKTDTWSGTIVTPNSDTAITGLSAKITPSSTSNKIAIFITVHGGSNEGQRESSFAIRLYRGATEIGVPSSPGTNRPAGIAAANIDQNSNSATMGTLNAHFVDSPSSTSELTYAVYMLNAFSASKTFYVNRTGSDTDSNYRNRAISTITLMEIQG